MGDCFHHRPVAGRSALGFLQTMVATGLEPPQHPAVLGLICAIQLASLELAQTEIHPRQHWQRDCWHATACAKQPPSCRLHAQRLSWRCQWLRACRFLQVATLCLFGKGSWCLVSLQCQCFLLGFATHGAASKLGGLFESLPV